MIPVAKLETLTKAPEKPNEASQGQDPTRRLFDAAHPPIGSIQPLHKPGDLPTFLSMAPPNWGSFAQAEKTLPGAPMADDSSRSANCRRGGRE